LWLEVSVMFLVPSSGVVRDVDRFVAMREVVVHGRGRIILSPPGSGKSYFVARHPQYVDADEFFGDFLGYHTEDWTWRPHSSDEERIHYQRCDFYLAALRAAGLWVVGSLFWDYVPDAIVILPEARHRELVDLREDLEWEDVERVRLFLVELADGLPEMPVLDTWAAITATAPESSISGL
jgi:hypothetical protein